MTLQNELVIREASEEDIPLLMAFIREMAAYEKLLDEVSVDADVLTEQIFMKHRAEARILECDGKPVGYCVYFFNFSTFMGRGGLYVEDIYLQPEYRGRGYGRQVFDFLEQIAREEGCGRMEWTCLDWNSSAQKFYRRFGADSVDEWTIFRKTL
ncbi:MAG: GNAT family N-acetyltransferase [Saccharofermentanales bacterium]